MDIPLRLKGPHEAHLLVLTVEQARRRSGRETALNEIANQASDVADYLK